MQDTRLPTSVQLPWTVRATAIALVTYSLVLLLHAALRQNSLGEDQIEPEGVPRAGIRVLATSFIAWGLWKRARWAWWTGVLLPGLLVVMGALTIPEYLRFRATAPNVPMPRPLLLVIMTFVAETLSVVLLLTATSRRAFRRPAA
jgi:hypothetical protein